MEYCSGRYYPSDRNYTVIVHGPKTNLATARDALHDAVLQYLRAHGDLEHTSHHPNKFGFCGEDEILIKKGNLAIGLANAVRGTVYSFRYGSRSLRAVPTIVGAAIDDLRHPTRYDIEIQVEGPQSRGLGEGITEAKEVETDTLTFQLKLPQGSRFKETWLETVLTRFPEVKDISELYEEALKRRTHL